MVAGGKGNNVRAPDLSWSLRCPRSWSRLLKSTAGNLKRIAGSHLLSVSPENVATPLLALTETVPPSFGARRVVRQRHLHGAAGGCRNVAVLILHRCLQNRSRRSKRRWPAASWVITTWVAAAGVTVIASLVVLEGTQLETPQPVTSRSGR